jgi:hypothetical protein
MYHRTEAYDRCWTVYILPLGRCQLVMHKLETYAAMGSEEEQSSHAG